MNKKVFCTLAILIQCIFGTTQAEDYALSLNNQKRLDANSNKEITNGYALVEQQGGAPALKLYGKEFTPLYIKSTNKFNPEEGTIEFQFKPSHGFKSPDKMSIASFFYSASGNGSVKIGVNHGKGICYPMFYLNDVASKTKNYGIYKPFELTAGQWHQIVASWNSNEMFLQIDGNLVQRLAKTFPLSFGNNFTLGWDANNSVCGYMRNFKIEKKCRMFTTGLSFSVRPNHRNPFYRCGELAKFSAKAMKDMVPLKNGVVEFIFTNDGLTEISRKTVSLAHGEPVVAVTMKNPGFIRCHAILKLNGTKLAEDITSAGFDVNKITPGCSEPVDFDKFWADGIKRLDRIPVDAKVIPANDLSTQKLAVYRVSFANINNTRIYGFLSIPKNIVKPVPAVVIIPGAGIGVNNPIPYFSDRVISMFLNVHPYEAVPDSNELKKISAAAYQDPEYCYIGINNPETFFFRRVFLGFNRAINWLSQHPDFDKKNMGITGTSQGGGSSLVMAGLNQNINYVVVNIPGLCDLGGKVKGRMPGWPYLTVKYKNNKKVKKTGSYYDTAYFAKRIKCPVVIIPGLVDPICSPSSIYATFNSIASPNKTIIPQPNMAHAWPPLYDKEYHKMIDALTKMTSDRKSETIRYYGFFTDDTEGRNGLRNPERGYRFMTEIGNLEPPNNAIMRNWRGQQKKYPNVTLTQAYCWLLNYYNRPISEEKLAAIRKDLLQFRAAGIKVLIRFAYERSMPPICGPDLKTTLMHMDQLAPIINEFRDVIFLLQCGFVGAFGEWHNSAHGLNKNPAASKIVKRVLEILPRDRMTTMRIPKLKRMVLGTPDLNKYKCLSAADAFSGTAKSRIGFANDGFGADKADGGTWPEPPLFANPGNPEFDMFTKESPYVPVDGEMFYEDCTASVDGFWAAKRLRLHHYTCLGMFQSHGYIEAPGKIYSMDKWKLTLVDQKKLDAEKLPVSNNFFRDSHGNTVKRNLFDYIRDHLGYRLELQKATFPINISTNGTFKLTAEFINRGFAIPIKKRTVYLVFINDYNEIVTFKQNINLRNFQPFKPGDQNYSPLKHSILCTVKLPKYLLPGRYQVGLWLPDVSPSLRHNPQYAIRFANRNVKFWTKKGRYGINVLGSVFVNPARKAEVVGSWKLSNLKNNIIKDSSGKQRNAKEISVRKNSCFEISNTAAFNFSATSPYTIYAKIKLREPKASGTIFSRQNGGVAGQYLFSLTDGKLVSGREIAPWSIKGNRELKAGQWYSVATTYDGRILRLYVNGELDQAGFFGPVSSHSELKTFLGATLQKNQPCDFFNGIIEEITVYNRALLKKELNSISK